MQQGDPEILQYILTCWKIAWQPIVGKHPLGHTGGYNVNDRFYLLHGSDLNTKNRVAFGKGEADQ